MRIRGALGLYFYLAITIFTIQPIAAVDLPVPPSGSGSSAGGHPWTIRSQNASLCDAGSKQWTGTVKVSADRTLFFWFFESRNDAQTDPVVLWING